GFNQMALTALGGKYDSPYWLTFNQAVDRGGNVRKGEKGTPIVFWKILNGGKGRPGVPGRDSEQPEPEGEASGDVEMTLTNKAANRVPLLRYYTVFNADQCEGLVTKVDLHPGRNMQPPTPTEAQENARAIVERADLCPIQLT